MNEKIQVLYNQLSQDGYDVGDINSFSQKMTQPDKARALYDTISKEYELGEFDSFYSKLDPNFRSPEQPKEKAWFGVEDKRNQQYEKPGEKLGNLSVNLEPLPQVEITPESVYGTKRPEYLNEQRGSQNYAQVANKVISEDPQATTDQSISSLLKEVDQEYTELSKRDKVQSPVKSASIKPYQYLNATDEVAERNLMLARKTLEDAEKILYSPVDKKTGTWFDVAGDRIGSFAKGAGEQLTNEDFWTIGMSAINRNISALNIAKKLEKGEQLRRDEELLLDSFANLQFANMLRADNMSSAYKGGQGTVEMASFIAQLATTGGLGKLATKGAEKALLKVIAEKVGGKLAKHLANTGAKILTRTGAAAIGATIAPAAFEKTTENLLGKASGEFKGIDLKYTGRQDAMTGFDSYIDGWADTAVEFATEMSGGSLGVIGKVIKEVPGIDKVLKGLARTKLGSAGRILGNNPILKQAGVHGFLGEYNEEFDGAVVRELLGLEDFKESFWNWDAQATLLYTLGPVAGFSAGMNTVQGAKIKNDFKNSSKQFDDLLLKNGYSQQEIEDLKIAMLDASPEMLGQQLRSIVGSMDNGVVEVDGKPTFNEEIYGTALQFAVDASKFNAYTQGLDEKLEEYRTQAKTFIEQNQNPDMGAIVYAEVAGKPVRVTKGNIVFNEDKLDRENSSKEFYYENENGEIIPANIELASKLLEVTPIEQATEVAAQKMTAPLIAKEQNEEVRPYEVGEQVTIDVEGSRVMGQIVDKTENGYKFTDSTGMTIDIEPRQIINEDNLQGVDNGVLVEYMLNGKPQTGLVEDFYQYRQQGQAIVDGNLVNLSDIIGIAQPETDSNMSEITPENEGAPASEDNTLLENGTNTPNNDISTENQNGVIIPQYPVTKTGEMDFDNFTPEQLFTYTRDNHGEEAAIDDLKVSISNIQSEIDKKKKGFDKLDMKGRVKAREAIKKLEEQKSSFEALLPTTTVQAEEQQPTVEAVPEIVEQPAKKIRERGKRSWQTLSKAAAEREKSWGEPQNLRELVLRYFSSDGRVSWKDKEGTKGLGAEYRYSERERRKHIGLSANDAPTPEQLAHMIWEANAFEEGNFEELPLYGTDTQEILNEILDVLNSFTKAQMTDEVNRMKRTPQEEVVHSEIVSLGEEIVDNFIEDFINNPEENPFFVGELTPEQKQANDELDRYFNELDSKLGSQELNSRNEEGGSNESNQASSPQQDYASPEGEQGSIERTPDVGGISGSGQDVGINNGDIVFYQGNQYEVNGITTDGQFVDLELDGKPAFEDIPVSEVSKTNNIRNEQSNETGLDNGRAVENQSERPMVGGLQETSGITSTVAASNNSGEIRPAYSTEEREELEARGVNPYWDNNLFRRTLRENAKQNGVWLDNYLEGKTLIHDQKKSGTSENDIYEGETEETIIKVNNLTYVKGAEHHHNLSALIDRVEAHNALFPNAAYTIKGFTNNKQGVPSLVLEQPFIKAVERNATQEEIEDYLKSRGFELSTSRPWSNGHKVWTNGEYELFDARPANVLKGNDGQLYFIDTFPHSVRYMNDVSSQIESQSPELNPSEAQKEAGNYKKAHVNVQGFDITIENPKGSIRSGVDENGREWSNTLQNHYGYFKRTEGKDGDQIDVFIGENPESGTVFVVDQNNPESGAFDESKVMLGFNTPEEAKAAYMSNYEADWKGFGAITPVSVEDFKKWLYDGAKQRKPFSEYKDTPEAVEENYTKDLSLKDKAVFDEAKAKIDRLIANTSREDMESAKQGIGFSSAKFANRYAKPGKALYDAIYKYFFDSVKNYTAAPTERPIKEDVKGIEKPAEKQPTSEAEKQTWEMSFNEFNTGVFRPMMSLVPPKDGNYALRDIQARDAHKKVIQQALSEGKPVPAEVLADYPELQKVDTSEQKVDTSNGDFISTAVNKGSVAVIEYLPKSDSWSVSINNSSSAVDHDGAYEFLIDMMARGFKFDNFNELKSKIKISEGRSIDNPKVSAEENEVIKSAKKVPATVRELADMDAGTGDGLLSGVVFSSLEQGDTFKVAGNTYTVTKKTKPNKATYSTDKHSGEYDRITVTITDQKGNKYTFETWDNWVQDGNKMVSQIFRRGVTKKSDPIGSLTRDIEGDITLDLINEYNQFHDKSDSFNIIQKALNKINQELSPIHNLNAILSGEKVVPAQSNDKVAKTPEKQEKSNDEVYSANPQQDKFRGSAGQESGQSLAEESEAVKELRKEIKDLKSQKAKLIKDMSDRNGLFGDTKSDPNDLFGGGEVDSNAFVSRLDEINNRIKTVNDKIKKQIKAEATGKTEAKQQQSIRLEEESLPIQPEGLRKQFKNEFGSFTSVFVYVNPNNAKEFMVQTTVRKANEDGTISMQKHEKWMPIEKYDEFTSDLKKRAESSPKRETSEQKKSEKLSENKSEQPERQADKKLESDKSLQKGKLGTGAGVYFDKNGLRVNENSKGGYLLNITARGEAIPMANIQFDSSAEAIAIAERLNSTYPNGVPGALLVEKVVEGWRNENVENFSNPPQQIEPEKRSNYGENNKLVSKDRLEELKRKMRDKLGNLNVGFDPEILSIGAEMAVFHIEAGARKFSDFASKMINDLGDYIRPYLKGIYEGARYFPGMDELSEEMDESRYVKEFDIDNFKPEQDVPNQSDSGQSDSQDNSDEIQSDDESIQQNRGASGRNGGNSKKSTGGSRSGRNSGKGGSGLFTDLFGESVDFADDQSDGTDESQSNDAGDINDRRNDRGGEERLPDDVIDSAKEDQDDSEQDAVESESFKERTRKRIAQQKKAESIPVKVMDEANIRETLPLLLPEQQDDVLKAEVRFYSDEHKTAEKANGKGFLFTNGTGTGKTFTGLGVAKRFDKQGKKNILIVVPSQKKVSDWSKDGSMIGLSITPIEDTKTGGKGAVVTTYANFRANKALMQRDFDLIIFDESHRIMEEKSGAQSSTYYAFKEASNATISNAFNRIEKLNPDYIKLRELSNKNYKEAQALGNLDMMQEEYLKRREKLDKSEEAESRLRKHYNENVKPLLTDRATQAYKNTKVLLLSATPFKGHFNLRYANEILFDWGHNEITNGRGSRINPEAQFFLNNFGSAYEWKFHRLQTRKNSNAEAIAMQEVQFAEKLMSDGVMSGRAIESDMDYSRDFPYVTLERSDDFNRALNDMYSQGDLNSLSDFAYEVFRNYQYTTRLFESLKASMSIPRIQKHLDMGRKVVVFHRRIQSNVAPPFETILNEAENYIQATISEIATTNNEEKKQELREKVAQTRRAVDTFRIRYEDLLSWEQTLNYDSAINQITAAFPDRVLLINGNTSKKEKEKNPDIFNDDESGKDIIIIQEEAGKEGISLHDTTGNKQRVLISLSLPQSSTTTLQIEGRVYRIGQASNAIFEYPLLGIDQEIADFGQKINRKLSTTENLAIGNQSRDLLRSFAEGVLFNASIDDPNDTQGIGGKEYDKKAAQELSEFRKAVLVYQTNQKTSGRRDQREGVDYYATPEPIGQKMVEWLGLQASESAMEPSAGHGAISMWFPERSNVTVIEPSYSLFSKLNARSGGGNRKMVNDTFENFNIINKFDGIAMNPPFGSAGKTAIDHVEKAFKHLKMNGRIVAIIPQGMADKRLDDFLNATDEKGKLLNPDARLVAEIKLPSVTFSQAGTKVNTRIVVIDKVAVKSLNDYMYDVVRESEDKMNRGDLSATFMTKQEIEAEAERRYNKADEITHTEKYDLSYVETVDELFDAIEDIELPKRNNVFQAIAQTSEPAKSNVTFEQFEQNHSKTGEKLFMVRATEMLEKEVFEKLKEKATTNNGYYSSYSNKSTGTRAGFTFKNQEDSNKFRNEAEKMLSDASILNEPELQYKVSETGFYSTVEKALSAITQEKGTRDQFKAMLLKNGAKQAELDWMGFDERFPGDKKTITKADILNWIDENRIEVQEVEKRNDSTSLTESDWDEGSSDGEYTAKDGMFEIIPHPASGYTLYEEGKEIKTSESLSELMNYTGKTKYADTKFSQYVLPGGENYKELLLTMPAISKYDESKLPDDYRLEKSSNGNYVITKDGVKLQGTVISSNKEEVLASYFGGKSEQFKSHHFDEPNILAHIRFNEREVNGERVLFLEEIQSDWAQKGKKEGFKGDSNQDEYNSVVSELSKIRNEKATYRAEIDPYKEYSIPYLKAEYPRMKELDEKENQLSGREYELRKGNANGVPDMPFKKTDQWVNLAIRRMMRYAAENGFDRIAWTNGEQQAERYDLSKQVDEIIHSKLENGKTRLIVRKNGEDAAIYDAEEKEIESYVGKDVAGKIINGEGEVVAGGGKSLSGLDLKVGGSGMKAFYDNIIPAQASKLGKSFGAKVEPISLDTLNTSNTKVETNEKGGYILVDEKGNILSSMSKETGDGFSKQDLHSELIYLAKRYPTMNDKATVQSLPITESMRKTAMEGMPLFEPQQQFINFTPEEIQDEINKAHGSEENQRNSITKTVEAAISNTLSPDRGSAALREFGNAEQPVEERDKRDNTNSPMGKRTVLEGFKESGYVDFVGTEVSSHQDIADLWSIHRSPYIEKMHVIFIKDGKIAGSMAATSGRINQSMVNTPKEIAEHAKKIGATQVYLLHNHPSGLPDVSTQDVHFTFRTAYHLRTRGIEVLGHVVVDHDKYSFIDTTKNWPVDLNNSTLEEWADSTPQFEYKNKVPKLYSEREIISSKDAPKQMFEVARNILSEPTYKGAIVYLINHHKKGYIAIAAYDILPEGATKEDAIRMAQKGLDNNLGSLVVFVHDGSLSGTWDNTPKGTVDVINIAEKDSDYFFNQSSVNEPELEQLWVREGDVEYNPQRELLDAKLNKAQIKFANITVSPSLLREAYQDRHLPVRKFIEQLRETGLNIENFNDWYKQSTHLPGKIDAQLEAFERQFLTPMLGEIDKLIKQGHSYRDVENYAILKHGIERNEWFLMQEEKKYLEKNPQATKEEISEYLSKQPQDYSGITAVQEEVEMSAEDYIKQFEEKSNTDSFWNAVKQATKYSLDKAYEGQIINKDQYNELTNRYKYYIPLRGFDKETAEDRWDYTPDMGTYYVMPLIKAKGRTSRSETPFAFIWQMAQTSINSANKNLHNLSIKRLAELDNKRYASTGLMSISRAWYERTGEHTWELRSPEYSQDKDTYQKNIEEFEDRMKLLEEQGFATQKKGKLNVGMFIKPKQAAQHEVHVMQNGEEFVVYFNGNPRVARAINGANAIHNQPNQVQQAVRQATRMMAANFTTRNPLFVLSNFLRDYNYASSTLIVKEGVKYEALFQKNIPLIMGALHRAIRGKSDMTNKMDVYAYEYLMNGGRTGYSSIMELNRVQKRVERKIKKHGKENMFDVALEGLKTANEFAENITRLSVYVTSREVGKDIIQSISDAKEVTVNFNRGGSGRLGGNFFKNYYLFFNANIQALANHIKIWKGNPGRMAALTGVYALSGFIAPFLTALIGGDDGEEEYMKLSDWERQTNFCIYTGNGFIKIPIAHELRVYHTMGDLAYQWMMGYITSGDAAKKMTLTVSDLIPANPMGATEASWAELSPDLPKPLVQLITNTSFMGTRIYDKYKVEQDIPGFRMVRTNKKGEAFAPEFLIKLAEDTHYITGGDGTKGGLDFNPDKLNHIMRGYFGGLYTMASQAADITSKGISAINTGEFKLKVRETPLKTFYASSDDLMERNSKLNAGYYDIKKESDQVRKWGKDYIKRAKNGEISIDELYKKLNEINYYYYEGGSAVGINDFLKDINKMENMLKEVSPEEQEYLEMEINRYKKDLINFYQKGSKTSN